MSQDPRPRYDVVQPPQEPGDSAAWRQIGSGYLNPDMTVDLYLDLSCVGHHLRLLPLSPETPPPASEAAEKGERRGA